MYRVLGLRQVHDSTHRGDYVSQPWPAQTVLDAGVPFLMLFDSYSSLIVENKATGDVDSER